MKRFLLSAVLLIGTASAMEMSAQKLGGNLQYVNMFMGSEGDHGQTTPAATVPFGLVAVCPDSDPNQHAGYDYAVPKTSGVSINRISGTGCSGVGGNIRLKPCPKKEDLLVVKGTEKAFPGFYETDFSNGVHGAFTASQKVAVEKYSFPAENQNVYIDFLSSFEKRKTSCEFKILSSTDIEGRVSSGTACARGIYTNWFRLHSDKPFKVLAQDETSVSLEYSDKEVEVRIGVSCIGTEDAARQVELVSSKTFDKIQKEATSQWKDKLSKIKVCGSTDEQKRIFYTSLYRIYRSPMDVTSADGKYMGTDGEVYDAEGRRAYNSWSIWDTYRAKFPMLVLLEPEAMEDMAASCVNLYRTGKQAWATPHESAPTIRTEHMGIMLLDAYRKGVSIDFLPGYDGMVKEVNEVLPRKSLDNKMELSNDLWALSQIAEVIGSDKDAEKFSSQSQSLFEDVWKKHFMEITPDFSKMRSNGLYQGTLWQYRWACPQYCDKMIAWHGKEALASELDTFFATGMFNQGNEPDIQCPFMFNQFGHPEKTQEWVRRYLTDDKMVHIYGGNAEYPEPFVGRAFRNDRDGYAPEMDEDDGTMSAWYMFAQMGFYPLMVGTDEYELFSPLFDKVTIKAGGKKTTIKAVGRKSYEDPVKGIFVDGKALDGWELKHKAFLKGSDIEYRY